MPETLTFHLQAKIDTSNTDKNEMVTLSNMTRDYKSQAWPCAAEKIAVLIKKFLSGSLSKPMTLVVLMRQGIYLESPVSPSWA